MEGERQNKRMKKEINELKKKIDSLNESIRILKDSKFVNQLNSYLTQKNERIANENSDLSNENECLLNDKVRLLDKIDKERIENSRLITLISIIEGEIWNLIDQYKTITKPKVARNISEYIKEQTEQRTIDEVRVDKKEERKEGVKHKKKRRFNSSWRKLKSENIEIKETIQHNETTKGAIFVIVQTLKNILGNKSNLKHIIL